MIRLLSALRPFHAGGKSTNLHQLLERLSADTGRVTVLSDQPGLAQQ